jgi:nondiscriminating glutamyl-tRNA synthetase
LAREFQLERVTSSPAIFDWNKLLWLNGHYWNQLKSSVSGPQSQSKRESFLQGFGGDFYEAKGFDRKLIQQPEHLNFFVDLFNAFHGETEHFNELIAKSGFVFQLDLVRIGADPENAALLATESAAKVLQAFASRVRSIVGSPTPEQFKAWMNEIKAETGVKGKELFHPVRIAITGSHSGPEFDKLIPLIEEGSRLNLPTHIPSIRERIDGFVGV